MFGSGALPGPESIKTAINLLSFMLHPPNIRTSKLIGYSPIFNLSDRPPRGKKNSAALYLRVTIEIKFLAILRLQSKTIGKIILRPFQCNQDQLFILSGTGDISEEVS